MRKSSSPTILTRLLPLYLIIATAMILNQSVHAFHIPTKSSRRIITLPSIIRDPPKTSLFTTNSNNNDDPGSRQNQNQQRRQVLISLDSNSNSITPNNGESSNNHGNGQQSPETDSQADASTFSWTQQWYPLLPLDHLEGLQLDQKPLGMTILDTPLVIWKSPQEGVYSVLDDTCPHRRAQLSTGKIYNNTLACRYHGWEFDTAGSCQKIPMMPKDNTKDDIKNNPAFCVTSYATQEHNGLLWVFMDASQKDDPPPIPVPTETNVNVTWTVNINPISWQSMIENSFDPSHAPFTHEVLKETKGPFGYKAQNAIPMERYEVVQGITAQGFALQHTPYHLPPTAPPAMAQAVTTRSFTAPVTQQTTGFFNSTLHFVPLTAGQTMVLGSFSTGGKNPLQKLDKLPPKLRGIVADALHFWFLAFNDNTFRFFNQDRIVMQAQDQRKSSSSSHGNDGNNRWNDVYPTTSDIGVKTMQTWARKFGKQPAFTMPSSSTQQQQQLSLWNAHVKYCPQCQRTMQRLARVAQLSRKVSNLSLGAAAMTLVVQRKRLALAFAMALMSVGSRYLHQTCHQVLDQIFVSPSNYAKYQMMPIYSTATTPITK